LTNYSASQKPNKYGWPGQDFTSKLYHKQDLEALEKFHQQGEQ
jgi:hypothetical protein